MKKKNNIYEAKLLFLSLEAVEVGQAKLVWLLLSAPAGFIYGLTDTGHIDCVRIISNERLKVRYPVVLGVHVETFSQKEYVVRSLMQFVGVVNIPS